MVRAAPQRTGGLRSRFELVANRCRSAVRVLRGKPPTGRIVEYNPLLDIGRDHLSKGLTFARLMPILRNGDDGDITEALQLFDEMEREDSRLFAVASTRRLALTGLEWQIESAAEVHSHVEDKKLAEDAAAFVRERFEDIRGLDCALEHLATGIGPNLAVLEAVWESGEIAELVPVPPWRLTMDLRKSADIRVITMEDRFGIVAEAPKFVVHIPNAKSGSPIAASIHRALAVLCLIKRLSMADWAIYAELFGMPIRIAKYRSTATPSEKTMLINMMKNLGSSAWAMVSEAVSIEFLESPQRSAQAPYEPLLNFVNREMAIAWLGGNLTTDTTGGTGTFAAAEVQDQVRGDLRNDDIKREARTVREQIIRPMLAFAFPGRDVPIPYFQRIKPETVDLVKEAELMLKAQQIGMDVPEDHARKRLGIPKPKVDEDGKREAILSTPDAFEDGLGEGSNA